MIHLPKYIYSLLGLAIILHPAYSFNLMDSIKLRTDKLSVPKQEIINNIIEIGYVTQRLDNFDPSNHRTFEQLYYFNNEHYVEGGPIFLHLGSIVILSDNTYSLIYGLHYDLAQDVGAALISPVHRYSGNSFPLEDASFKNLSYFTIDQVFADTAHLIQHIKSLEFYRNSSVVIAMGSLYGGSLSIWLRQKYPHLVNGAWASGSPVLARPFNRDYLELAGGVLLTEGGQECYNGIEEAIQDMDDMIESGQIEEVEAYLKICEHDNDIDDEQQIRLLFDLVIEIVVALIAFDMPGSSEFICQYMTDETYERPIERLSNFLNVFFGIIDCLPIDYSTIIDLERETSINSPAVQGGARQLTYLQCIILGWFLTTDSQFHPFGSRLPPEFMQQLCEDVFDEGFSRENLETNTNRFNVIYGGIDQKYITNVIYTHGFNDPYRTLGIQTNQNDDTFTEVIKGFGHGFDALGLYAIDDDNLINLQRQILSIITDWVRNDD